VAYTGANAAAGSFTGGASTIGIAQGVVLSSGQASGVVGQASAFADTNNNGAGDADLTVLASANQPTNTFDAAVLEFDFVPQRDLITFQYVFGSEEYPETVGQLVTDVFALFLNGQNIAVVPGTTTAVSINTVNAGANSEHYVDNGAGAFQIALDAFTKVFTIRAAVTAGVTNHLKLAVADSLDLIVDSALFIKAGSFAAVMPNLRVKATGKPASAARGSIVTFTVTAANVGNFASAGVFVTMKLPSGLTFVKAGSSKTWVKQGTLFRFSAGSLEAGQSRKLVFKARVAASAPIGKRVKTLARIGDDGLNGPDVNLADNASKAMTRVV